MKECNSLKEAPSLPPAQKEQKPPYPPWYCNMAAVHGELPPA